MKFSEMFSEDMTSFIDHITRSCSECLVDNLISTFTFLSLVNNWGQKV